MEEPINKNIIAILKPLQYMSINKSYVQNIFIWENHSGKPFLIEARLNTIKANIYA